MSAADHLREAIAEGCTRDDHDHIGDHRAEVIAEFEAYPGELDMLRGVLGVVRTIARHSDIAELRRVIAEHYADERAAYEQAAEQGERDSATTAPTSTPQPGPSRVQCDHGNYVAHTCPACQIGTRA